MNGDDGYGDSDNDGGGGGVGHRLITGEVLPHGEQWCHHHHHYQRSRYDLSSLGCILDGL